jgi:molybdopterin-guanine dinucleotide biosynthesis protein A
MGGVDKGLQAFRGMPLAMHALFRLQAQVGETMLNANRNLAAYESMGVPVWPDALPDYPGPLAGFLVGLERCETPYLVVVPCDTRSFPTTWSSGWPRRSPTRAPRSPSPPPAKAACCRRSRCSA